MIIPRKLNYFTLIPNDPSSNKILQEQFDNKTSNNFIYWFIISLVGFFINIIGLGFSDAEGSFVEARNYVPIVVDLSRVLIYAIIMVIIYRKPYYKNIFICSAPLIFSISVTEAYKSIGKFEYVYLRFYFIMSRVATVYGMMLMQTEYIGKGYLVLIVTTVLSFIYPVIRSESNLF